MSDVPLFVPACISLLSTHLNTLNTQHVGLREPEGRSKDGAGILRSSVSLDQACLFSKTLKIKLLSYTAFLCCCNMPIFPHRDPFMSLHCIRYFSWELFRVHELLVKVKGFKKNWRDREDFQKCMIRRWRKRQKLSRVFRTARRAGLSSDGSFTAFPR